MLSIAQDLVWKALADPTRRRVLETIEEKSATTGELVDRFGGQMVRTAVMKHLDVLEAAKLIRVERVGRVRYNHIRRKPLEVASAWLEKRVQGHQNNLKRLKKIAEAAPNRRRGK